MEMNQHLEQQIALLQVELLLKEEQIKSKEDLIKLKEEQLQRKNERILYLERQLFGRRSEKKLPQYCQAQLSLFDSQQGKESLEQETPEMISLVEEITQKAEKRRKTKREQAVSTTIIQAPLKASILAGCIAGESLLSQIIVDKFLYHIPEYRQAKRFKELGVDITTSVSTVGCML